MARSDPEAADRVLGESEVRRILERAADLDSRGEPGLTVDEVRRIAAEANISPHAVELALRESEVVHEHGADAEPGHKVGWRRILGGLGLFGAGAALAAFLAAGPGLDQEGALLFLGVTGAFGVVRGLMHRARGSLADYQKELALLMGGCASAFLMATGVDGAQAALMWWAICAIGGAGIVRLTLRPPAEHESGAKATSP